MWPPNKPDTQVPAVAQHAHTAQLRTTTTKQTLTGLYATKDTPHVKNINFFLVSNLLLLYKYQATTLS